MCTAPGGVPAGGDRPGARGHRAAVVIAPPAPVPDRGTRVRRGVAAILPGGHRLLPSGVAHRAEAAQAQGVGDHEDAREGHRRAREHRVRGSPRRRAGSPPRCRRRPRRGCRGSCASVRRDRRMASAAPRRSPDDEGQVGRLDRDVGARARSRGRGRPARGPGASLTPSPTIATTRPSACRRRTTSALPPGSTSAITSSMPDLGRHGARRRGGVAGEQHRAAARGRAAAATASALDGLDRVGHHQQSPHARRPRRRRPPCAPAPAPRPGRRSSVPSSVQPPLGEQRGAADHDRTALDHALHAEPLAVREALDGAGGRPARRGPPGDGPGDRVLGAVLQRARPGAGPRPRSSPPAAITSTSAIPPVVTVPVLSSTIGVDAPGRLEDLGPGDQRCPSCGAATRADQQGGRRGQAERAGAGDDQHGDGGGEREGRAGPVGRARTRAWPPPARSRPGTKTAEMRSASRCTGRLARLGLASTRRAIWASGVSAPTRVARTTSRPPALIVAPVTASPGPTSDGHGLAGQQRRVDRRRAVLDDAVGRRSSRPGRTTNRSPTAQRVDRRPAPRRRRGRAATASLAPSSSSARSAGAGRALGARLEVPAGQQEGGDDAGHLEVDVVGARARGR